jgi:hypothetical protein
MFSNLTLTICLTLGAPPSEAVSPAGWSTLPVPGGVDSSWQSYAGPHDQPHGASLYSSGYESQGTYCEHCGHYHRMYPRPLCDFLCSPCSMTQRYPYYPKDHGHYYFRPYHMYRVELQRELAATWGEDPRNPYAHSVFDRVYEQLRAEQPEILPPGAEPVPEGAAPMPALPVPAPPIPAPPVPPTPEPGEEDGSEARKPAGRKSNPLRPVAINAVNR